MPSTICSISRCSSGSPPAIDDHRRAAFVDRLEAFVDAEALIEDRVGIVDLAAAGAGEVAAEQRLQHQNQRIAPDAAQMLRHDIGADTDLLAQRNCHGVSLSNGLDAGAASAGSVGELRRHPEADVLGDAGQHFELDCGRSRAAARSAPRPASSGAEAPAVMPTELAPSSQRGSRARASSIR